MPGKRGLVVLACIGLLACAAKVSAHDHPGTRGFYNTWMMPDAPNVSCCHETDCYPTEARSDAQGWLARRREDGKWLRVPAGKVEMQRDNPDGRNHLCAPPPGRAYSVEVFCFIAGSGI